MQKTLAGVAAIVATLPLWLAPAHAEGPLASVTSWAYQLQRLDIAAMAAIDADLIVIDYSFDGTASRVLSASQVATLKVKPDGTRRIVLAYFSIGEAEDYRFYWQPGWNSYRPAWLLEENPEWDGNYDVRYWSPEWQSILYGSPSSYLDRIISAGFDGIYLDRVDAFERADPQMNRSQRAAQMITLVRNLASYARGKVPGFIVVPQNGEELLFDASYRSTIDGLGKEDLLYGADSDKVRNPKGEIRASLDYLGRLTSTGKPVLLVEYLDAGAAIAQARADAATLGMTLFITDRELDNASSR